MVKKNQIILLLLIIGLLLPAVSYAQFGEVAGPLLFNVSVGGQNSLNVTIVNEALFPAQYRVILPTLNVIPNETTPTVTAYPMNGSVPKQSQVKINVTVNIPFGDKPGQNWNGILQILLVANNTGAGAGGASATIQAGLAKIMSITSLQPLFNPLPYEIGGVIVAIVVVVGCCYYYFRIKPAKKARARPAAAEAQRAKASVSARKTTTRRKARGRAKKKSARRKGTGKRRKSTARRRRRRR